MNFAKIFAEEEPAEEAPEFGEKHPLGDMGSIDDKGVAAVSIKQKVEITYKI